MILSHCEFSTNWLPLLKNLLLSIVVANLKSVIMSRQPFHLEEFISPLVFFCLLFQQLLLHESCSPEIVKTCNRPRFSCVFIFRGTQVECKQSAQANYTELFAWGGKTISALNRWKAGNRALIGMFSILVAYQEMQFEGRSLIYFPLLSVHAVFSHVSGYKNLINSRTQREWKGSKQH